jgi:GNAT superfamily N-acetyltransferase
VTATVRPYSADDLPQILPLALAAYEESAYNGRIGYAEPAVRALIEATLRNPGYFFRVLIGERGFVEGFILGCLSQHFFSNDLLASDLLLYIRPAYRRGRHAALLVKSFEEWAKSKGVRELWLGTSTGVETPRVRKFYERGGYKPHAYIHFKSL